MIIQNMRDAIQDIRKTNNGRNPQGKKYHKAETSLCLNKLKNRQLNNIH